MPAAQAVLIDKSGRATPQFYDLLRRIVGTTALTPELVAEVRQLLEQIENLPPDGFMPITSRVQGQDSIDWEGLLSKGITTLRLQGDTSDQRSTWYYGTNGTNEKGWYRFYDALDTGPGILKRNSGYIEIGEVADSSDLPDSGNVGEAYWVRGENDIEDRGLWVWDADAGEWALDTEASGIVGLEIAEGDYGDISVSDEGATWTIDNNAVTNEKLRDSAALSVIGRASDSTGDPADIAASADKAVLHRDGNALAFTPIDSSYISDFDEAAQDAVGGILANSADIEFTYDDSAGEISAELSSTVHASLALADSALQPGDNISELANDANYVASGDNVSVLVNDAGYLVAADLAAVAFSGDYDDLANTPTIPPDVSSATFLTVSDETSTLANSRRLVAGSNVTLDTSTPGEIIINASGGGGGGQVDEIVGTPDEIVVDNTDPTKPVLSLDPSVTSALGLALTAVQPGDLAAVATSGDYGDLANTPSLAAVATSGDYDDLINTPTIPPDISSATFITADDETATLGNSLKLVAGSNITFDDSTPGELKISASGGGGGGTVESVIGTTNEIDVDSSDPANPVVSLANAVRASLALADSAVQPGDLAAVAFSGDYSSLTGIPSTFPPSAHTHGDSEITSLAWSKLTGVPATFTPSAHTHSWTEITNKPTSFTPSAHTHSASDITSGTLSNSRLSGVLAHQGNIPSGADLNTYTITGIWHQRSNANAASGTNYPVPLAGMLRVYADDVMVYQEYFAHATNATYIRKHYNGAWQPWHQVYDSGHKPSLADLGGGTITGNVAVDGTLTVNAGAGALSLRRGSQDRTYMTFYDDAVNPNTRSAYFGFGSPDTPHLSIVNEKGGDIYFATGSQIRFNAPSIVVQGRGGVLHYGDTFTNARVFVRQGGSPVGTQEGDITIIW
jgi:hypothetical protein